MARGSILGCVLALAAASSMPAPASGAGEVWLYNPETSHYYAQVNGMTWADSEAYAVSLGGHLVTINDQAEQDWLAAHFTQENLWIGFNDRALEGTWVWSSGQAVTYTNWATGEPNDWRGVAPGGEDGAAMNFGKYQPGSASWNDWPENLGCLQEPDYDCMAHGGMAAIVEVQSDIDDSPFQHDIEWLYAQGITAGCTATSFCPDDTVTRGQMAAFLDRALHLPATSLDFFTDDETSIFEGNINRLAASNITRGCSATEFCPTGTITREQMAAFLDRALHLPATSMDYFTDDEDSMFEASINRMAAANITRGCTPTTFCPKAPVSRGQMAAFLHRALD